MSINVLVSFLVWNKFCMLSRKYLIVVILSVVLVVVGLGLFLGLYFGLHKSSPPSPTVTPPPVVPTTPPAPVLVNVLLKDTNGNCYEFPKLSNPLALLVQACSASAFWIQNQTDNQLTFYNPSGYTYCIQMPGPLSFNNPVLGSNSNCSGVQIKGSNIVAPLSTTQQFCISINNNAIIWGDCTHPLAFSIVPVA